MKLLHVITGLNVGGAETMLARLVERSRGDEVDVVTLMPLGFVGGKLRDAGFSVQSLNMKQGLPSLSALVRLTRIVRQAKPDAVMAWMHHAQVAASLALVPLRSKPPLIWNVRHSLNGFAQEKYMTRVMLRALAAFSAMPEAIVYNSGTAAKQYRDLGFVPKREIVLPNGFEIPGPADVTAARIKIESMYGVPRNEILIGMIARAHPMKDTPNLIAAFARALDAGLNAHLLLVGEGMADPAGPIADSLAQLPRQRWSVGGHSGTVAEWLHGLDVLALPSAWGEGFPNVVGEAMAAGVPCVATDVGDARQIIHDTGIVVPPRDPAALGAALIEMARAGADERAARGRRARQRMANCYAVEDIATRYRQLFADVATGKNTALTAPTQLIEAIER